MTSNIHNLIHVVEEVERFGPLNTISSYPFENYLFKIKNMLRSGRLPLPQIINRITEMNHTISNRSSTTTIYPHLKYLFKNDSTKYSFVQIRDGLTLTTKFENKWFYTRQNQIIAMQHALKNGIVGAALEI